MGYFLKKTVYALLTLIGIITVIFILFSVLPGDSAKMMLGQNQTEKQLATIKTKYGFDKPLTTQYLYYLNDLSPLSFHSKSSKDYTYLSPHKYKATTLFSIANTTTVVKWPYLRTSFAKEGKNVSAVILETFPNTLVLAVSAILIAIFIGGSLGVVSALKKNTWADKLIQIFSVLGISVPSFFSAILFSWVFGFLLHNITNLEMTGSLYILDNYGEQITIQWKNLILPAIVLGIRPLAVVSQLMRNELLEVLNQDYIRTAKAKGLTQFQILKNHAIKNALNPLVTAISGWFASMLAGAVFVEYIFGWNGLGKEIVNALNTLDLPVIMGAVLVIATSFILINILVDIIYTWLDPRVKLE